VPSRQSSPINRDDTRRRKPSRHLMLNAGVSIGAFLDMISYSLSHEALEFTQQRQKHRAYTRARWRE